jgi:hypothetical protein
MTKQRFLVAYDYETGGVWASLLALSEDEIRRRYPALRVVSEPPAWLNEEKLIKLEERMTIDIDDDDNAFLRAAKAAESSS